MQTLREEVQGKDLPEKWRKKAKVLPDETVEIIIQPPRDKQMKQLFETMNRVSDKAEKKGLTDEKLAELLREE